MVTKNLKRKRILITILVIILVILLSNMIATKWIYDSVFPRYDCNAALTQGLDSTLSLREEKYFNAGENTLCGYLYTSQAPNPKNGLIVLASGHNACADSYLWQIKELMEYGWSVFAFDSTGCCNSEGDSAVGFSQELLDLEAALTYIEAENRFGFENIALFGHSRGGYAACCVLSSDFDIDAVVSVSGVNSPMEAIIGAMDRYIGKLAYVNYGPLWLYQSILFGKETVNLKANEVLSQTQVPVLIVHGANDREVPTDAFSIYAYKDSIEKDNVSFLLRSAPESSGHTNLLFDADQTANNELIAKISDFLEKTIDKEG